MRLNATLAWACSRRLDRQFARSRQIKVASNFPHLKCFPTNTRADAQRWAADIGITGYAIDEQTDIKVVDGSVEVVSEGEWKLFLA